MKPERGRHRAAAGPVVRELTGLHGDRIEGIEFHARLEIRGMSTIWPAIVTCKLLFSISTIYICKIFHLHLTENSVMLWCYRYGR